MSVTLYRIAGLIAIIVAFFLLQRGIATMILRFFDKTPAGSLAFYLSWLILLLILILVQPQLDYGLFRWGRWRAEWLAIVIILLGWLAPNILPKIFAQAPWQAPPLNLALFNGVIVAPVIEEILFRGVLQRYLAMLWPTVWLERLPLTAAVLLSALLFSLWHFPSPWAWAQSLGSVKPYLHLAGGLSLSILRERTGSIWPGVIIHCAGNLSAYF
ncbi:MAG: CPBP family intramembrane metalloprotease [Candidatus Bipolaricaulota bacterium]|nr:CPBP family intramembrane metalloprotease [Candidatus Bipolaricaulota bacterium]MDW8030759.1 CPBP family intramembrane glutamic endopeptidase [Candidatus Bipolaricaulota bacterium]